MLKDHSQQIKKHKKDNNKKMINKINFNQQQIHFLKLFKIKLIIQIKNNNRINYHNNKNNNKNSCRLKNIF